MNMVKNVLICLKQSILVDANKTCSQEKLNMLPLFWYKYWRLNVLVWLATTNWWSNRSDTVLMADIACHPRPSVSYFQMECDKVITYMGRNLILNSINRGLVIRLYRKKSRCYRSNSLILFNWILSSTANSINFQLVNICNVSRNLSSC